MKKRQNKLIYKRLLLINTILIQSFHNEKMENFFLNIIQKGHINIHIFKL